MYQDCRSDWLNLVSYCPLLSFIFCKRLGLAGTTELNLQNFYSSIDHKDVCFPGNAYNSDLQLTGYNGTLHSPLSPDWYPPGLSCYWLITVPKEKAVKLRFDSFELEPSWRCLADYVEILDGESYYSRTIGKFCGSTIPKVIRSSGRYMQVRFRADRDNSHYGGFTASFTAEGKASKVTPLPSDKPSTAQTPTTTDDLQLSGRWTSLVLAIIQS